MSFIDSIATLHLATPEEARLAQLSATEDKHSVPFTTHIVRKNSEIVGAISLASVPMVLWWQHTKLVNARESLMLFTQVESMLRIQGLKTWALPCYPSSPYLPYIEKLGYVGAGQPKLFFKKYEL